MVPYLQASAPAEGGACVGSFLWIEDMILRMRRWLGRFRPRTAWTRFMFRAVDFKDNHAAFRTAYLMTDPYNLKSAQAAYRFAATNRIIGELFGPLDRVLEIGCAEGYQSQHLKRLCAHLHGIDVSPKAVARAKTRCPAGHFSAEDLFSIRGRFDLVVAAEVLYYVQDIPAFLDRMTELGSACLVTYYQPYADRLDPYFARIPGARREMLQFKDVRWSAVWWTAADAIGARGGSQPEKLTQLS